MVRKAGAALVAIAIVVAIWAIATRDTSPAKASAKTTTTTIHRQVTASMTAAEVMSVDSQFRTFVDLLAKSGVKDAVAKGKYTYLTPSTDAFAKLGEANLKKLTDDPQGKLEDLIRMHILPGTKKIGDLFKLDGKTVTTIGGEELPVKLVDGFVTVGGVKILKADIDASNGEIHVLDGVMSPAR